MEIVVNSSHSGRRHIHKLRRVALGGEENCNAHFLEETKVRSKTLIPLATTFLYLESARPAKRYLVTMEQDLHKNFNQPNHRDSETVS